MSTHIGRVWKSILYCSVESCILKSKKSNILCWSSPTLDRPLNLAAYLAISLCSSSRSFAFPYCPGNICDVHSVMGSIGWCLNQKHRTNSKLQTWLHLVYLQQCSPGPRASVALFQILGASSVSISEHIEEIFGWNALFVWLGISGRIEFNGSLPV